MSTIRNTEYLLDVSSLIDSDIVRTTSKEWRPTGGQSVPAFDYYMAPGVAKSFAKNIFRILDIKYPEYSDKELSEDAISNEAVKKILKKYVKKHRLIMNDDGYSFIRDLLSNKYSGHLSNEEIGRIIDKATEITDNDTHQSMEAVVHNLNSMHSRAGEHTRPNIAKAMVEAA